MNIFFSLLGIFAISIYINLRMVTYPLTLLIINSQLLMAQKMGVLLTMTLIFTEKTLYKISSLALLQQWLIFYQMSGYPPEIMDVLKEKGEL